VSENLTVESFLRSRREAFGLTVLAGRSVLDRVVPGPEVHRPGLALAGFVDRFPTKRVQVLGETEIAFLSSLPEFARHDAMSALLENEDIPMVIISKGLPPPSGMAELAETHGIPLLGSTLSTTELYHRLSFCLEEEFAPKTTVHGTLVDVYGVGLLYTGRSGVGKSECALDLVERNHRLVADDVVHITRKAPSVVMGTASPVLGHHLEIRGVGIIDIEKLFGIRSVRMQKRIEVEVRLEMWQDGAAYERLGLEEQFTTILGVQLPLVIIPLSPGKNITVISEVIAMNHMLKTYGHDTARMFSRRLAEELDRKRRLTGYLESDYE
jgi:HPr kinase/phosphorylase